MDPPLPRATLDYRANFRQHAERLGEAVRILHAHGCRLGLEFVGPKQSRVGAKHEFVHTLRQVLDLVEAVGPGAGVLLDSWHWHTSQGTVVELQALTRDQIVYVHVNDAPTGINVDDLRDNVRHIPGETGVIDIGAFMGALRTSGYDGPVVAEPFFAPLREMPPHEAAERVGRAMQRIWNAPPRPT